MGRMALTFRAAHDKITPFRRTAIPEGTARASLNESHLAPIAGLAEAVSAEVPHLGEYGSRAEQAVRNIARAHGTDPERVLLGSGSTDLVRALVGSVCEPGDEVIVGFASDGYADACRVHAAEPVCVPTSADGSHDVDALLAAITQRTRILLLASPRTPSGRALTRDQLARLIAEVPAHVVLALDEAYSEFASSPRAAFVAPVERDLMKVPENVVVLRSLSRGAGLPGIRVGYLIADPRVVQAVARVGTQDGVDRHAIAAAEHCFSPDGLAQIEDRVEWIKAERQRIERTLRDRMERAEIEGKPFIDIVHSDGNFVWLPVGERADELRDHLIATARVAPRSYAGEGVRYTVIDEAHNDAFIDGVAEWATRAPRA
jgi:histidinol-phosphate aminotransferase